MLRKIFGYKRDEVTGEWRRLYSEELYDLYFSPNIIRMIKSRRMRGAEHVARIGGGGAGEGHTGFRWGDMRERYHLEDLGVYGRIILKWVLKMWAWEAWTGFIWLRIGTGGVRLCLR
jgi:hypothetical protein